LNLSSRRTPGAQAVNSENGNGVVAQDSITNRRKSANRGRGMNGVKKPNGVRPANGALPNNGGRNQNQGPIGSKRPASNTAQSIPKPALSNSKNSNRRGAGSRTGSRKVTSGRNGGFSGFPAYGIGGFPAYGAAGFTAYDAMYDYSLGPTVLDYSSAIDYPLAGPALIGDYGSFAYDQSGSDYFSGTGGF